MMTGVDIVHVPYRGEVEAQADLLSGRAQVIFNPIISAIGAIKGGTLRALAVTTAKRVDLLPDVPTIAESVPGYEVEGWLGLGAPSATPPDMIDKLNREVNAGIDDPGVRKRLVDLGNVPTKMSPAEYGKLIAEENEKWAKVIKFAGIKLD
jgi:tripartite-type tricarboxylate transporter receptor subunit TctC